MSNNETIRIKEQFHCLRKARNPFRNWKQRSVKQPKKCIVSTILPPDISSSKSYEALNFQRKTVWYRSLMYSHRWKNFGLSLDSLSNVSQLHWENWKQKHCPRWYVCHNWWNSAARIPQFLLEDNNTNSNSRKTRESCGVRLLLTNAARTHEAELALWQCTMVNS